MAEVCYEVDPNLIARSFEYFADYFFQLASFFDDLEESLCDADQEFANTFYEWDQKT
jgi:hypothetical protein